MRTLKLFFTGLCMGIADLIPGISGGTIAFLFGIYEDLLLSIQSIKVQSLKKIAWPFLLPLGAGIATTFLTLASLFHFLLTEHLASTFGFFFGVMTASTLLFLKQIKLNKLWQWTVAGIGIALVFYFTSLSTTSSRDFSFLFLVISGALASSAMLLPGISGSYVLVLLGVYPVAISAIATRTHLFSHLFPLLLGIILGLVVFSRVVTFFLKHFKGLTLSLLTGFMIGGLKAIYPFSSGEFSSPILFAFIGLSVVFLLEFLLKRKLMERRFKE